MKITCISASNVEIARSSSASMQACRIIRDLILEQTQSSIEIEIIRLLDYEFVPCRMSGQCFSTERCPRDESFNRIFETCIDSDAIFLVIPHYASIPSKLTMILEKMEEIYFLHACDTQDYRFPLSGKPVGLVAHGGQTEDNISVYQTALLDPVAAVLRSVQMNVVSGGEGWPDGITFGITGITPCPHSIFMDIEHDWEAIQARLTPLVENVMAAIPKNSNKRHNEQRSGERLRSV